MTAAVPFQVCEPLYSSNHDSKTKTNVNQGGTSSAKTYTILQVCLMLATEDPGCVITVVGQDVPNLKKGAIRDTSKIIASSPFLQSQLYDYATTKGFNKTERIYEFKNGSIIEFNSYDNEQDARSGKRDYLFINEANGISYEIYWQLWIRTKKKVFLDYNPSSRFWVHEKVIGQKSTSLFITDHRHNPFLTQEQHDLIENIDDEEYWKVYARGMTGQIRGLIYPTFKIIEIVPSLYPVCYGLDFGFNHKMALYEISKDGSRLFAHELIYETEMTISDLVQRMKELDIKKKPIYADHAAPDKITDLQRAGFQVYKADKDVKNGIDYVKRHQIYLTKSSKGAISEIRGYKWKEKDGITYDEPVKFKDDAMDAIRYGAYTGFRKGRSIKVADTLPTGRSVDLLDRLGDDDWDDFMEEVA